MADGGDPGRAWIGAEVIGSTFGEAERGIEAPSPPPKTGRWIERDPAPETGKSRPMIRPLEAPVTRVGALKLEENAGVTAEPQARTRQSDAEKHLFVLIN